MNAKIQVGIRLRPFLETEIGKGYQNSKVFPDAQGKRISMKSGHGNNAQRVFEFDQIFDQNTKQNQVYEQCGISQLVTRVLDGFHSTIFAYGQTGSGKTYTMEGKHDGGVYPDQENKGIAVRALEDLFDQIAQVKSQNNKEFNITCSFLQIYNERIYDLLGATPSSSSAAPGNPSSAPQLPPGLKLRWNAREQFQVENLSIFAIKSSKEAQHYFLSGVKNRVTASHKLNMTSSRSHTIFTITVQTFSVEGAHETSAKLQIVDLAGSERVSQTGTEGKMAKESIDINKSLFTLRQVITALSEINQGGNGTTPTSSNGFNFVNGNTSPQLHNATSSFDATAAHEHQSTHLNTKLQRIPYRESKLTSLLKQSIGGNCYCLMIACIVPSDAFIDENISTLHYASRATYIKNQPIKNEDPNKQLLAEVRNEYKQLREELEKANSHIAFLTAALEKSEKACAYLKSQLQNQETQQKQELKTQQSFIEDKIPKKNAEEDQQVSKNEKGRQSENQPFFNSQQSFHQGTDYDNFSDRLIESITLVRQLLESNKELRQQADESKSKLSQLQGEIADLTRENQELREQLTIFNKTGGITKQASFMRSIQNSAQRPPKNQEQVSNRTFHKDEAAAEDEGDNRIIGQSEPSDEGYMSADNSKTFRKNYEEGEDFDHKIPTNPNGSPGYSLPPSGSIKNSRSTYQSNSKKELSCDIIDLKKQQQMLEQRLKQQNSIERNNKKAFNHTAYNSTQGSATKNRQNQPYSSNKKRGVSSFQSNRQNVSQQQQYQSNANQSFNMTHYSNPQSTQQDEFSLLQQSPSDGQNTLHDSEFQLPSGSQQQLQRIATASNKSQTTQNTDSALTNFGRYTFYQQNFHNLEKIHQQQMVKLQQQGIIANDIFIPSINKSKEDPFLNEINSNHIKKGANNTFKTNRSNSLTKGQLAAIFPATVTNAATSQIPPFNNTDQSFIFYQQNLTSKTSKSKNSPFILTNNDENSVKQKGENARIKAVHRKQNSFNS